MKRVKKKRREEAAPVAKKVTADRSGSHSPQNVRRMKREKAQKASDLRPKVRIGYAV